MSREFALKTLGPSEMIHSYRAPSQGDSSKWIEYTDYEWHRPDQIVSATTDDKGEILRVTVDQRRGAFRGPFGVVLGKDSVRTAVEKRVGTEYAVPAPIGCADVEGEDKDHEILFSFEAFCGPEGSITLKLFAPSRLRPDLEQYCDKRLPIDELKRIAGSLIVRSAELD